MVRAMSPVTLAITERGSILYCPCPCLPHGGSPAGSGVAGRQGPIGQGGSRVKDVGPADGPFAVPRTTAVQEWSGPGGLWAEFRREGWRRWTRMDAVGVGCRGSCWQPWMRGKDFNHICSKLSAGPARQKSSFTLESLVARSGGASLGAMRPSEGGRVLLSLLAAAIVAAIGGLTLGRQSDDLSAALQASEGQGGPVIRFGLDAGGRTGV
ncbi:hypothetical protein B0T18DRAFT_136442 [Schizothecium vesticola]|uniref:Uncharacterized protein n=1 Tax=Schizothecium vesticola TaxID=314040 RepID=A0AA40K4L3_9PEZI|nr:hypothetical protein B0T18DRAFT_136442 [Schizothecium vesticola]